MQKLSSAYREPLAANRYLFIYYYLSIIRVCLKEIHKSE